MGSNRLRQRLPSGTVNTEKTVPSKNCSGLFVSLSTGYILVVAIAIAMIIPVVAVVVSS